MCNNISGSMRERKHVITSCPTLIYCSKLKLAEQVFTPAHHHQAAPFLLSAYEQVDGEKINLKSGDHKLVCVCVYGVSHRAVASVPRRRSSLPVPGRGSNDPGLPTPPSRPLEGQSLEMSGGGGCHFIFGRRSYLKQ